MPKDRSADFDYASPVRRIAVVLTALALGGLFLLWRIDSPRVERFRAAVVDRVVPSFDWALAPVTKLAGMIDGFQSYARIYEQNQELRRELQQMKAWKEAAVQLEQQNAKLLAQNQVRLDPKLTSVSGVVMADSGSPFRQSVLLNVGARDGVKDGWATMDGLGLVGRISGVGQTTSRVILLTDASSRVPVTIQPSGQKAILGGDNSGIPPLDFIETPEDVRPGDRVVSSGDGGVFPSGMLVGEVVLGSDQRLRVRLAADYQRLDFLRVLRSRPAERITDAGALIVPIGSADTVTGTNVPDPAAAEGGEATPAAGGLLPEDGPVVPPSDLEGQGGADGTGAPDPRPAPDAAPDTAPDTAPVTSPVTSPDAPPDAPPVTSPDAPPDAPPARPGAVVPLPGTGG